jgi:hypothetical protein
MNDKITTPVQIPNVGIMVRRMDPITGDVVLEWPEGYGPAAEPRSRRLAFLLGLLADMAIGALALTAAVVAAGY